MSNLQQISTIPIRSRRERARVVNIMVGEGKSTRDIARELGTSHGRVSQICQQFGIPLSRGGTQRFSIWTPRRRGRVIEALAERAGVSPSAMLDRIIGTVVDDGEETAAKRLGKLARPVNRHGVP